MTCGRRCATATVQWFETGWTDSVVNPEVRSQLRAKAYDDRGTSGQAATSPTTRVVATRRRGADRLRAGTRAPQRRGRSGDRVLGDQSGHRAHDHRGDQDRGWLSHEYPAADQDWPLTRSAGVRKDLLLPREPSTAWASLGYSVAGRVIAVAGDVTDIAPGDLVACAGSQCAFHAARVVVPRSLTVPVPAGLGADKAAFVTLGADRARSAAARPADPRRDDRRLRLRRAGRPRHAARPGGRHVRHRGRPRARPARRGRWCRRRGSAARRRA